MRRKVVVTGIGSVNPLGNNVADTWAKIMACSSGITKITRFDATHYKTQIAGEVKGFDPSGVLEAKDARKMETFIQYSIVSADEALRDANLVIDDTISERIGVSVGVGIGALGNIELQHLSNLEKPGKISPFFIPMTIVNMASGLISIHFKAKNFNASTTSACSSSNHSIGLAARMIERGDADLMIAGGAESAISTLAIGGFGAMKALSTRNDEPEKASRPYDVDRDGFVLSEGSGILILEAEDVAKKRGARIYAELAGYSASSDANHITAPTTEGPLLAMKWACKDAGIDPSEIDYINAHGTSTPIGDLNEIKAIRQLMGDAADKVSVSSTKSNHGHLLGGAGGVESVICIKAMTEGIVPPTINVQNLDPACDIDITPNQPKKRDIRYIMNNSFGFGGTNATLVFKRYEN